MNGLQDLETKISFSLLINLISSGKKNYVILKPFITFTSKNKQHVQDIAKQLPCECKMRERNSKKQKQRSAIIIQNLADVKETMNMFKKHRFIDQNMQKKYVLFNRALEIVEKIGHINTEFKEEMNEYLQIKFELNNEFFCNSRRITNKQWTQKIKEHVENT